MCNSIFGKGQQVVGAGQDGVRRGLTTKTLKISIFHSTTPVGLLY
jgi:hypothetical protein